MAKTALSGSTCKLICKIRFEQYVIPGLLPVSVVSTDIPIF